MVRLALRDNQDEPLPGHQVAQADLDQHPFLPLVDLPQPLRLPHERLPQNPLSSRLQGQDRHSSNEAHLLTPPPPLHLGQEQKPNLRDYAGPQPLNRLRLLLAHASHHPAFAIVPDPLALHGPQELGSHLLHQLHPPAILHD